MTTIYNVAIIGVSGFARCHYENLMDLAMSGAIRLAAATIINREQEAVACQRLRAIGCEIFADYRDMLAEWEGRLDLCVIPTPIHLHAPMTIAALKAGCNVLVEKPAAGSLQDVDAMMEAEARSGRFVAVGFQQIYTPEALATKRAILSGLIGRVTSLKCLGLWPRSNQYYRRNNWAGRLRQADRWVLDTPFNNAFAHPLNLLCFLAGGTLHGSASPRQIQAELYRTRAIESLDTACLRILLDGGASAHLWLTHSCLRNQDPYVEIQGDLGSVIWTPKEILHRTFSGDTFFRSVCEFAESGRVMLRTVLRKLAQPETFVCGLDIARRQTMCSNGAIDASPIVTIDSAYLSTDNGCADGRPVIIGIDEISQTAFDDEKLWSELSASAPWAREGEPMNLDGYTEFQGRQGVAAVVPAAEEGLAALATTTIGLPLRL